MPKTRLIYSARTIDFKNAYGERVVKNKMVGVKDGFIKNNLYNSNMISDILQV